MPASRRDFLKFVSLAAGAAGVGTFVPECLARSLAIEPAPGSTFTDAEHIVILMQENRSFDHALGTLQGVRGFNDPRALRLPNGNTVFAQTSAATGTTYTPWRLNLREDRGTWLGSLPHTRDSQVDAWNNGLQNNWLDAKRPQHAAAEALPLTLGYYTRADLPFYYALADAFTVCDQSYAGVMTSTMPNRLTFMTGKVRDEAHNPASRTYTHNEEVERGGLSWKTYPERLTEAGITWRQYQNEITTTSGLSREEDAWLSNFGDNALEFFAAYNVQAAPGAPGHIQSQLHEAKTRLAELQAELAKAYNPSKAATLRAHVGIAGEHVDRLTAAAANCGDSCYAQLTPHQRSLFDAAFSTSKNDLDFRSLETLTFTAEGRRQSLNAPKGDVLHQFRADVESGQLPTVSWLVPSEHFSDHPDSPWYGAWYVSEVMSILTKNPEVWKKTIFILTYDENDGFFDHGASFVAADPTRPETGGASAGIDTGLEYATTADEIAAGTSEHLARNAPIGLGFRVPTIIASPWTRGGYVNSQLFDHTSTLQFLEHFLAAKFGKTVREENISPWRRAVCGDLTSCFRPFNSSDPRVGALHRDSYLATVAAAKNKSLPNGYKELSPAAVAAINAHPAKATAASPQEPGTRAANALPYELYAHGALTGDGKAFQLELTAANQLFGSRSAGAPFNVYLRNLLAAPGMSAATYAVRAGNTLRPAFALDLFQDAAFEIEILGPNGFYRRFTGSAADAPPVALTSVAHGELKLHLHNPGTVAQTFTVTDNSYGAPAITKTVAPGSTETLKLSLESSHHWYDFAVRREGSKALAHFAGRMETGAPSRTDPLMARG